MNEDLRRPLPWSQARQDAAERAEGRVLRRSYQCLQIAPGPGQTKPTSYLLSPKAAIAIRAMPDCETLTEGARR